MFKLKTFINTFISFVLITLFIGVFIKLLPFILLIFVILMIPSLKFLSGIKKFFSNYEKAYGDFRETEQNQAYKQCSVCKKRAVLNAVKCDFCGKFFRG